MADDPLPPPPPTLGQVRLLFTAECFSPPWVIVGAVGWDSMVAFWSIFSPNWKDLVKEGPGRRSWIHQMRVVLDDAEEVQPEWFVKFKGFGFAVFEFLDFIAFWFMVGEALAEGLLNSTSLIWAWSPCNPGPTSHYFASKTPVGEVVGVTPEWQPACSWLKGKQDGLPAELGTQITIPANSQAEIAIAVNWYNIVSNLPQAMDMRIVDLTLGVVVVEAPFDAEHYDPKKTNGIFLKGINTGGIAHTYQWQFRQATGAGLLVDTLSGHCLIKWDTFPTIE